MRRATLSFLGLTALGILAYWGAVATRLVEMQELVPGFLPWFYSFPLADLWIAAASMLAIFSLRTKRVQSIVWLAAAGSGLLFLALNALLFGHNTGLLYQQSVDEYIEIAIKVYSISVGAFFLWRALVIAGESRKQVAT
ncbi:MAG: hypothetical protein K1X75_13305 [Leptospirales bacterium]|nr:hypothetical protein [Leptospirales bacterium]